MTLIEEIYAGVLPELARHGIEDTTEHRLWALQGLRDGWMEEDLPPEAGPYIAACTVEIFKLKMDLMFPIFQQPEP